MVGAEASKQDHEHGSAKGERIGKQQAGWQVAAPHGVVSVYAHVCAGQGAALSFRCCCNHRDDSGKQEECKHATGCHGEAQGTPTAAAHRTAAATGAAVT